MKTRIDFVSNSSSCSFIVEEPKKFIGFVKSTFDADDFCSTIDSLNVSIKACVADKKDIGQAFGLDSMYECGNELSISSTIGKLLSVESSVLDKIRQIEFECDDYDTDNVVKLSVLRRALCKSGVQVSDQTEHDLMFTDDENGTPSTMAKLYELAFSSK